jgi:hypothetical protein
MTRDTWERQFTRQLRQQLGLEPEQLNFRSSDVFQRPLWPRTGDHPLNRSRLVDA